MAKDKVSNPGTPWAEPEASARALDSKGRGPAASGKAGGRGETRVLHNSPLVGHLGTRTRARHSPCCFPCPGRAARPSGRLGL